MTPELRDLDAVDVDELLEAKLLALTLAGGEMAKVFRACRGHMRRHWVGRVVVADVDGQVVGWALRWRLRMNPTWRIHLFVDPAWRRRGIGAELVAGARRRLRRDTSVKGCPWDPDSVAFWAVVGGDVVTLVA